MTTLSRPVFNSYYFGSLLENVRASRLEDGELQNRAYTDTLLQVKGNAAGRDIERFGLLFKEMTLGVRSFDLDRNAQLRAGSLAAIDAAEYLFEVFASRLIHFARHMIAFRVDANPWIYSKDR